MLEIAGESISLAKVLAEVHRMGKLIPLLRDVAVLELLDREAARLGLRVIDEELQQAADRFRHRHGLSSAEATAEWLQSQHWSPHDFQTMIESDLLRQKLAERVTSEQVADCFAANGQDYARVRLQQIVARSEGIARELIQQIVEEGAEFEDIARHHSVSPSSAAGGDLGILSRVQLPDEIAEAVFSAEAGTMIGPLLLEDGAHVYRVFEFFPPELDKKTTELVNARLFEDWLSQRLADVKIDLSCLRAIDGAG